MGVQRILSQTVEDYLKIIFKLEQSGDDTVSTNAISSAMGLSAASVTNMLKRISGMGLAEYKSHYGVKLTESGKKIALEIIRHHRLLELYLSEVLGYSWDQVHEEAEQLEHHISEQFEDAISQMLGNPKFDPHGDPIPMKDGTIPSTDSDLLTEVEIGKKYIIRRITDQTPDLLRYLGELKLMPNSKIKFISKAPFNGPVTLLVNKEKTIIGYELATHIHVIEEKE